MRNTPPSSAVDDREAMIRLLDIVGREHIFAPYHMDTPLPAAPGLLAVVRATSHRFAGVRSIVHPPWWDVLYVEQADNVCRRAGRLLRDMQAHNVGPTMVMVSWMRDSTSEQRQKSEQALIEAHDPELNKSAPEGDIAIAPALAACG